MKATSHLAISKVYKVRKAHKAAPLSDLECVAEVYLRFCQGHNGRETWRTSCYSWSRLVERTWRISAETSHSCHQPSHSSATPRLAFGTRLNEATNTPLPRTCEGKATEMCAANEMVVLMWGKAITLPVLQVAIPLGHCWPAGFLDSLTCWGSGKPLQSPNIRFT